MKTLVALLLFAVAAVQAEIVGQFEGDDVHHYSLSIPADNSVYDFVRDTRVINGSDAQEGQFPFVARLSIVRGSSGSICSGSLISEHYGLSASHCVTPNPETITNVGFLIGTVNRNVAGTVVNAADFWFVEQPATLVRDLSMFRFADAIQATPTIGFIRLPTRSQGLSNYEWIGWPVTLIGWGRDNTGTSAIHKQFAQFRVLSNGVCSTRFTEYELCYVDDGTSSMSQPGDSGGPVIAFENGVMTQVGVHAGRRTVSGITFHSAVRISHTFFLNWIEQYAGIRIRDN
jgi:secreted trypsin-like serine protease